MLVVGTIATVAGMALEPKDITAYGTLALVCAQWITSHLKGRKGKRDNTEALGGIRASIAELRAFIVGPDGENGVRGDVRQLKTDVRGILDRELARAEDRIHGGYRPT